jgi:hypothetical protein
VPRYRKRFQTSWIEFAIKAKKEREEEESVSKFGKPIPRKRYPLMSPTQIPANTGSNSEQPKCSWGHPPDVLLLLKRVEGVGQERILNTSLCYLFYPARGSACFNKEISCSRWEVRCERPRFLPITPSASRKALTDDASVSAHKRNYFEISVRKNRVYLNGDPPFREYRSRSKYGVPINPSEVTSEDISKWFEHISFIYGVRAIDRGPKRAPSFR